MKAFERSASSKMIVRMILAAGSLVGVLAMASGPAMAQPNETQESALLARLETMHPTTDPAMGDAADYDVTVARVLAAKSITPDQISWFGYDHLEGESNTFAWVGIAAKNGEQDIVVEMNPATGALLDSFVK